MVVIIKSDVRNIGNDIEVRQLVNGNYNEWTRYNSTNDTYPCDNGGNNGSNIGSSVFYTSTDLCGIKLMRI